MNPARRENESRLLEKVARYREEYRGVREAALREERERRHAGGEVYIEGCWVAREAASQIASGLQRHEYLALIEIVSGLFLVVATAIGLWRLFAFLMLP